MSQLVRLSDYYDAYPSRAHHPGDVWSLLPTFGVLPNSFLPGLIITPACDLANRKVETLTYLPIMPISQYLRSRGMLRDILRETDRLLQSLDVRVDLLSTPESALGADDLAAARTMLDESLESSESRSTGMTKTARRCRAGLDLALAVINPEVKDDGASKYRSLVGDGAFRSFREKVVRNALRPDLHFLPADGQKPQFSAVISHSVALFRYPLSVPIDILDSATDCSEAGWAQEVKRLCPQYGCVLQLHERRPLKLLRVKTRFISDLLTRFTGLFGRLGSPDFSDATIQRYARQIGGEE